MMRRLETPIVGRTDELDLLRRALASAIDSNRPHLVTILAPAGVGKSRLVRQFTGEATAPASCAGAACPMATGSPTGRSARS